MTIENAPFPEENTTVDVEAAAQEEEAEEEKPTNHAQDGIATTTKEPMQFQLSWVMQIIGWLIVGFGLLILPWAPSDWLTTVERRLFGILIAVIASWFLELVDISVTAMMIGPLLVMYGVTTTAEGFRYYADPINFLFYGALFIGKSMSRHALDRRLAYLITESTWVGGIPWRMRLACMVTGMFMSMWLSNTGAATILISIILGSLPDRKTLSKEQRKSVLGTLLGTTYCCNAGGMGTTIGTPPNLVAIRLLEEEGFTLNFLDWMKIGTPLMALVVAAIFGLFSWLHPAGTNLVVRKPEVDGPGRGRLTWGEKWTLVAFVTVVFGWLMPPLFDVWELSFAADVKATFPTSVVAMVAAFILFLVPDIEAEEKVAKEQENVPPSVAKSGNDDIDDDADIAEDAEKEDYDKYAVKPPRSTILPWNVARTIDWSVIMIVGGGLALGNAMRNSGLAKTMGDAIIDWTGVDGIWSVTIVFTTFTIFFTEVCSNTATANVVIPLVIAVCKEMGVSPIPPVMGATFGCSCAFMMPISTPPNAIAYQTRLIPFGTMVRSGIGLNI
eukprot:gene4889-7548_t